MIHHGAMSLQGAGGSFDPIADFDWFAAYWPDGPAFRAEGYTDGDQVNRIPDEVGGGNYNLTDTASDRVLYKASDPLISGRSTVELDNSIAGGEFRTSTWSPAISAPYAVVVVFHQTDGATTEVLVGDRASDDRYKLSLTSTGEVAVKMGASEVTTSAAAPFASDTTHAVVTQMNPTGTTDKVFMNGVRELHQSIGEDVVTGIRLGSSISGTNKFEGSIAFIGVYEGVLDEADNYAELETWFSQRFGVTI